MAEGQAIESHTESSPNPPNIGQVTAIQRPDWVAEKFYDAESGVINFEAMAKSYGELERARSAAPAAPTADETVTPPTPAPAAAAPKPAAVVPPVEMPAVPGVTPEAMKSFSAELQTAGKLSDASYADLLSKGYNKATVDAYVKGLTADAVAAQAVTTAVEEARIADAEIATITDSIGGKDVLKEMQAWATASMTPADLKTYNDAVSSNDVAKVRLAVAGLHQQFTLANGTQPKQFGGSTPPPDTGDVYSSSKEATAAIRDPRYNTDPGYRAQVAAKLGRSNVL